MDVEFWLGVELPTDKLSMLSSNASEGISSNLLIN
jgi:hypothetical protein